MTTDRRHIDLVLRVFEELVASGATTVSPGDVGSRLRELGDPMGMWAIRRALTVLEAEAQITLDPPTGTWRLMPEGTATKQRRGSV